ncbi:type IV secretory system conjugative DNA transfer family protein [Citrobacter freundii]|nr:type IV secretory system conjugative DNA transfer family protein [Citrobacter freundii]HCI2922805.1 type IV secretory system conjugative DNA transfer family protein [Pseudomonas aeruginosa]
MLGQETVVFQTMARALDSDKTGISDSQQHTGRPLLTPDDVRNLPAKGQLLFLAGQ